MASGAKVTGYACGDPEALDEGTGYPANATASRPKVSHERVELACALTGDFEERGRPVCCVVGTITAYRPVVKPAIR